MRILTKYLTQKHNDEVSIKDLYYQKKQKDQIFEGIFQKFTIGQKLDRYDEMKELE